MALSAGPRAFPEGALTTGRPSSSGREAWIFRAASPDELLGSHVDLMASSLAPDDELRYLLYAPIWDAATTPFGQSAVPASHALAVTGDRLIVTADPHCAGVAPTVRSIPFDHLLGIEWGRSILTAWTVLRFASARGLDAVPILFRATAGSHHVAAALRTCRGLASGPPADPPAPEASWDGLWGRSSIDLRALLEPLLLRDERPEALLVGREIWDEGGRRGSPHRICRVTAGIALVTNHGLYRAERVPTSGWSLLDAGVAASWFPPEAVARIGESERMISDRRVELLEIRLERTTAALSLALAPDSPGGAGAFRAEIAQGWAATRLA